MKRFRFRLEAVRAIRDLAERAARERFGVAQQKVAAAADALRATELRRAELTEALAGTRAGSFRPGEQIGGMAALRTLERAEVEARRVLAETQAACERVREQWLEARRGLKVIEKLEARARLSHRDAAEKAEQALLDELASLATTRVAPLA
jgi:flagellar export protein FliJ